MPPLLFALFLNVAAMNQAPMLVTGTIVDASGAPVPDATVRLEVSGRTMDEYRTGTDGRFEIRTDASIDARLIVIAPGFAQHIEPVPADRRSLQITLQPAPFFESVNVTSSRTDVPRADPTVTVSVLQSSEVMTSAAV